MKKEMALMYLDKINKEGRGKTKYPFTRLYFFSNNGEKEFVEDYSYFANDKFMSDELLESLSKGKTLSSKLQDELNTFVIEVTMAGTEGKGILISDPNNESNVLLHQFLKSVETTHKINTDKYSWHKTNEKGTSVENVVKEAWDKTKENIQQDDKKLSFEDFQQQALHRLQQQFLNTPDNHNTVLTRMNIIQMIKDLKELGLK